MKSIQASYQESCGNVQEMNEQAMLQLPEVYYAAARIAERLPRHVEMEDLVQAGVVGLLEASRNYDPNNTASFATFAKFRIRGAILDSLRELDWGSRAVRKKSREIDAAVNRLRSVLGRQPKEEEIAKEVSLSITELHAVRSELDSLNVLGQQVEASFEGTLRDLIESAPAPEKDSPFENVAKAESRELLAQAISELDEREMTVLSLYYRDEMTLVEVSEILGLGASRISQIHRGALAKLRKRLAGAKRSGVADSPRARQPNAKIESGRNYECTA